MKSKRYVIVSQTRFFTFLTLLIAVISLILFSVMNMSGVYGSALTEQYEEHWVADGDSLWDIAKMYAPDNYDIRKLIYDIKEYNNLDSSMIFAGDKLFIPVVASND